MIQQKKPAMPTGDRQVLEANLRTVFQAFAGELIEGMSAGCTRHPHAPIDYDLDIRLDCGYCHEEALTFRSSAERPGARLIAAAPDMLQMLELALSELETYYSRPPFAGQTGSHTVFLADISRVIKAAKPERCGGAK